MKYSTRIRIKVVRDYVIGWTVAFLFLSIVRGVGTEELGSLQFGFTDSLLMSFTLGPMMGLISGIAQVWAEEKWYRRVPIRRLLLIRFVYGILFLGSLITIAYFTYQAFFGTDISLVTFAFDTGSGAIYFFVIVTDFVLVVIRQVSVMLGEGNLGKLLQGKFYHPREEDRIFMFLDLQSSTSHAEKLGHIQYSSLIQDCFNDLGVVMENEAEIYQYVGDEVVLTWPFDRGVKQNNAIQAFYRFKDHLNAKATDYESKYGIIPFFKAGLHGGTVTVTEIGKYKKEIAYHGDPINTAARIQGQCNALGAELLISSALMESFDQEPYLIENAGHIHLKGKEHQMELYKITKK
ncbi:MAG: adenylate/guanylate cyclase domain-containing protein [Cytophagales bacterium]|nr:adenylate/guanylate cyclase domain-containing protein [Cytophagales bacterium]